MSNHRNISQTEAGFSTLELLIAFAVLTLSLTAVILVAFGNQTYAVDTELSQRALYLSEQNLDETLASAVNDFQSLSGYSGSSGNYTEEVSIADISECAKRINSTVSWTQGLRNLDVVLSSTIVDTDTSALLAHDCATQPADDDWDNPDVFVDENISGQSDATAIDEFNHFIYLTTAPPAAGKDDFFIYEFDEASISLTERGVLNTSSGYSAGLYDVDVAGNYAFVASASSTEQLQIIDITNPDTPFIAWKVGLPGVDPTGSYPEARVVHYYDDRLFVGTRETNGPEFHIFDVSNLFAPPVHLGSLELNHTVRDIVVRGDHAYLATSDNNNELMVIDVSNPAAMIHPDTSNLGFNAPGANDGSSLYVGADRIYLGRAQETPLSDSFYILEKAAVLDSASNVDGELGAHDIGLSNNTYVAGIRISGRLAFLALDDPTTGLMIYNIEDPANIFLPSSCAAYNFSENTVGIDNDLLSQYLFVANGSNAEIRIIYDQIPAC